MFTEHEGARAWSFVHRLAARLGRIVRQVIPGGATADADQPDAGKPDADKPDTQDAYLALSWLLLEVLASGQSPGEVGRTAGGLIGQSARADYSGGPQDALSQLESLFESRGFMPKQIGSHPDVGFVLGRCPYESAALANPRLVCGLHRALAEGMLEALGGDFEVTDLVARHPTTAGCRLDLRAIGYPPESR